MFAIVPGEAGQPPVSARYIETEAELRSGEVAIAVDRLPPNAVVGADRRSFRQRTPAELLETARRQRLDRITEARKGALSALTAEINGATYDANEESLQRMRLAIDLWQEAIDAGDPRAPQTVDWLDADNNVRRLTLAQLRQVSAACGLAWQTVWARNSQAKQAIKAARTAQDIAAVDF